MVVGHVVLQILSAVFPPQKDAEDIRITASFRRQGPGSGTDMAIFSSFFMAASAIYRAKRTMFVGICSQSMKHSLEVLRCRDVRK
jgi:hypothetical protein